MGTVKGIDRNGAFIVANSGGCIAFLDNTKASWSSPSGHTLTNAANWLDRRYANRGTLSRTSGANGQIVSMRNDQSNNQHPHTQLVFLTDVRFSNIQAAGLTCRLFDPVGAEIANMQITNLPSGVADKTAYMTNAAFLFDRPYTARYVQIEFAAQGTTTANVSFARFFAGPCFYRARGLDKGWSVQVADYSTLSRLPSGVVDVDVNEVHRVVKGTISDLTHVEAFGVDSDTSPTSVYDWGVTHPATREVVIVPTCDDTAAMSASAIIGWASSGPTLRHLKGNNYQLDVAVTEGR